MSGRQAITGSGNMLLSKATVITHNDSAYVMHI